MSELAKATEALAAGHREDARAHAWNAARRGRRRDLPDLARLAEDLDDPALAATIAVRRLRRPRFGLSERVWSTALHVFHFCWWLGWASLVFVTTMSDRAEAIAISAATALAMTIAVTKGWIEVDG